MNDILILKLLHLLLFVYWLGGDLGTFYASRFVARPGLSKEQRSTALTIMMGVDQGPRICMTLMLGTAVHLSQTMGFISIPDWTLWLVWLLCLGWLAMVLLIHFGHGKSYLPKLTKVDFGFRIGVIAACVFFALDGLSGESVIAAPFIAWKLLVFAGLVACGLGIRIGLKPFIPAFTDMMMNGISDASDKAMQSSLSRVRPFVYLIWVGLLFNTALGLHLYNP